MRAINNEQVEGFPKKNEVKTVFVEHDLDSADTEQTVIGWTMKKLGDVGITIAQSRGGEANLRSSASPENNSKALSLLCLVAGR